MNADPSGSGSASIHKYLSYCRCEDLETILPHSLDKQKEGTIDLAIDQWMLLLFTSLGHFFIYVTYSYNFHIFILYLYLFSHIILLKRVYTLPRDL